MRLNQRLTIAGPRLPEPSHDITFGMKSKSESDEFRALPLDPGGAAHDTMNSYEKQRPEFEARAEFVKAYRKARRNGGQPKLDPVLASHIGLNETGR